MIVIESKFMICYCLSQNKHPNINKHCYHLIQVKFGDEKRTAIASVLDDVFSIPIKHYGSK